jgi:hypothetical protein
VQVFKTIENTILFKQIVASQSANRCDHIILDPSVIRREPEAWCSNSASRSMFSSDKNINLLEGSEVVLTKPSGVDKLHFALQETGDQHIKCAQVN